MKIKQFIWMLLLLAMVGTFLFGCKSAGVNDGNVDIPEEGASVPAVAAQETTVPESSAPTETVAVTSAPTETEPVVLDSAEYEIVRNDHSIRDDTDRVLVELYYDQVVLKEVSAECQAINLDIAQDYEKYRSRAESGEFEEYSQYPNMNPEYPFFYTIDAEVTNNSRGVFSIRLVSGWYMGGIFNADYYGLTYDLHTGQPVSIAELVDQEPENLEEQLKSIVWDYLQTNYGQGMFSGSEETLAAYKLDEIPYYIQDGEIILVFPTYTFAPGAAGATIVSTGVYIDR